jgi:hypothetical protein
MIRPTHYALRTNLLWLISILCLFIPLSNTLAHGGGQLQVGPVATGPYQVSVWTDPIMPRVDRDLHVTVAVGDGVTNEPVLDAAVTVTIYPLGGETAVLTKPALAEVATNRLFYEADLRLADEGEYRVVVDVASPEGAGQVEFVLSIFPPLPLNWLFVLLAVGGAGWLVYLWRKRPLVTAPIRPRRPPHRISKTINISLPKKFLFFVFLLNVL